MSKANPDHWNSMPGNFDALNARELFESDNEWGIPTMRRTPVQDTPEWLAPYRTRIRSQNPLKGAYHFFLDDYRFESVWNRPKHTLSAIQQCPIVLSPDFSLYRDWPLMLQMWNTYRNRWCGAFWQAQGLTVIPTISWGTPDSYHFAFAGVQQNSVVAISTVGTNRDSLGEHYFIKGFQEMINRLSPSRVLCYGAAPVGDWEIDIITYPNRWRGIRDALKRRK